MHIQQYNYYGDDVQCCPFGSSRKRKGKRKEEEMKEKHEDAYNCPWS